MGCPHFRITLLDTHRLAGFQKAARAEPGVDAAEGEEVVVAAALDDAAAVYDEDFSLVVIDRFPVFSRSKSAPHSRDWAVGFPHLEVRRSCGVTRAVADQRQTAPACRWRFF